MRPSLRGPVLTPASERIECERQPYGPGLSRYAPALFISFRGRTVQTHEIRKRFLDHFAKAGANDRVWNALEKLAVRDSEAFVDYYALGGRHRDDLEAEGEASVRRHFGGTMTPVLQLGVDGDRAWIAKVNVGLSAS